MKQIYQTESTKLNLQNQIYQSKCLKCEVPHFNKPNLENPNLQKSKVSQVQAWPSLAPACFMF